MLACPLGPVLFSHVVHPADPPGQLNVPGEQRDPLGVDRTQVCIGEQHDKKRLCSLEGGGGGGRKPDDVKSKKLAYWLQLVFYG